MESRCPISAIIGICSPGRHSRARPSPSGSRKPDRRPTSDSPYSDACIRGDAITPAFAGRCPARTPPPQPPLAPRHIHGLRAQPAPSRRNRGLHAQPGVDARPTRPRLAHAADDVCTDARSVSTILCWCGSRIPAGRGQGEPRATSVRAVDEAAVEAAASAAADAPLPPAQVTCQIVVGFVGSAREEHVRETLQSGCSRQR
ncbi:hypothetical protein U9M48_044694 [Paspalum notatum var. saurae]|uniref:Uncharacterized protein n=1 Tax=Paspalum notatum var. saurae TaxID=547442 RepID=A0AAQ3UVJ6_PASNO